MREVETKYSFDGELNLPETFAVDAGAERLVEMEPLQLKAAYFDTEDLRLARNGVTLRHRTGDEGGDRWTLKLPAKRGREEIEFDGPPTKVPDQARDLVRALAREKPLRRVVTLKTKRARWSIGGTNGADLAELVDDSVVIYKSGRVAGRFREIEIESRDGTPDLLARVGAVLEELGARPTSGVPKAVRALGEEASAKEFDVPDSVDPSAPSSEAIQVAIASATERIQKNDPLARLGDPEGIHQMRVGARHLRSDLKTFAPLVESEWADSLRNELKWIADVLGEARDLDVLAERLKRTAGNEDPLLDPLWKWLDERDTQARAAMLAALRSDRYDQLLENLIGASTSPAVTEAAAAPCSEALPPLVAARWAKLRKKARSLGKRASDDELHQVRIDAKKARYAAEAASVALDKKSARDAARFADLCSKVQDTLGTKHDSVVAMSTVEEAVREIRGSTEFNLAAGRLIEREELAGDDARKSFKKAWNKLDRKKNVSWMKDKS